MPFLAWFAKVKAFVTNIISDHNFWPCALTFFFGAAAVYLHGVNLRLLESVARDIRANVRMLEDTTLGARMLEDIARDVRYINGNVGYLYGRKMHAEYLASQLDSDPNMAGL